MTGANPREDHWLWLGPVVPSALALNAWRVGRPVLALVLAGFAGAYLLIRATTKGQCERWFVAGGRHAPALLLLPVGVGGVLALQRLADADLVAATTCLALGLGGTISYLVLLPPPEPVDAEPPRDPVARLWRAAPTIRWRTLTKRLRTKSARPRIVEVGAEYEGSTRAARPWLVRMLAVTGIIAVAIAASITFSIGIQRSAARNNDVNDGDQGAYIDYAQNLQRSADKVVGDRNRMPVFPYLLALSTQRRASIEAQYPEAKRVSVIIGIATIVVVGLWALRRMGATAAVAFVLIWAFGVVMFKATTVQADLLFYPLLAALGYLLLGLLRSPKVLTGALVGAVAGIAHLTKASVPPLLILFGLVALAASLLPERSTGWTRERRRSTVGTVATVFFVFGLTVLPYARNSERVYGNPVYNVNSTYYLWYDNYDEVLAGAKSHADGYGRFQLPADEVPTVQRYFREHSPGDVTSRFGGGLIRSIRGLDEAGYLDYILPVVALTAVIATVRWRATSALLARHRVEAIFVIIALAAYALLIAWWHPIAAGPRFMLELYLPVLGLCFILLHRLSAPYRFLVGPFDIPCQTAVFSFVCVIVLSDLTGATARASLVYGGA